MVFLVAAVLAICLLHGAPAPAGEIAGNWKDFAAGFFDPARGDNEQDAYTITTPQQLAHLATQVNSGISYEGKYFKLAANIDLGAHRWTPIGSSEDQKSFKGHFDGRAFAISGLVTGDASRASDDVGLFGCTRDATIANVVLDGVNVVGKNRVGGLVGHLEDGKIENCLATGRVTGTNPMIFEDDKPPSSVGCVGGLVGYAIGSSFKNCLSAAVVNANKHAGGIVGVLQASEARTSALSDCLGVGSVFGGESVRRLGGVVGDIPSLERKYCRSADLYYDLQLVGRPATLKVVSKWTDELVKGPLERTLAGFDDWTFASGFYPCPTALLVGTLPDALGRAKARAICELATVPLFLDASEQSPSVRKPFTVPRAPRSPASALYWSSKQGKVSFYAQDDDAERWHVGILKQRGEEEVVAVDRYGHEKVFRITIPYATVQPDLPPGDIAPLASVRVADLTPTSSYARAAMSYDVTFDVAPHAANVSVIDRGGGVSIAAKTIELSNAAGAFSLSLPSAGAYDFAFEIVPQAEYADWKVLERVRVEVEPFGLGSLELKNAGIERLDAFESDRFGYALSVDNAVSFLDVTAGALPADARISASLNGVPVWADVPSPASGALDLNEGDNTFAVTVEKSGAHVQYEVSIVRAAASDDEPPIPPAPGPDPVPEDPVEEMKSLESCLRILNAALAPCRVKPLALCPPALAAIAREGGVVSPKRITHLTAEGGLFVQTAPNRPLPDGSEALAPSVRIDVPVGDTQKGNILALEYRYDVSVENGPYALRYEGASETVTLVGPGGILSWEQALEQKIVSLDGAGITFGLVVVDGVGEAFAVPGCMVVYDGAADGRIVDPLWFSKKVHETPSDPDPEDPLCPEPSPKDARSNGCNSTGLAVCSLFVPFFIEGKRPKKLK